MLGKIDVSKLALSTSKGQPTSVRTRSRRRGPAKVMPQRPSAEQLRAAEKRLFCFPPVHENEVARLVDFEGSRYVVRRTVGCNEGRIQFCDNAEFGDSVVKRGCVAKKTYFLNNISKIAAQKLKFVQVLIAHPHPNFIKLFQVGINADASQPFFHWYIAMEKCDGDVGNLMDAGKMGSGPCVRMATSVFRSLSHLKSLGLRDDALKPENIFVKGHVFKLGDPDSVDVYQSEENRDLADLLVVLFQIVTGKGIDTQDVDFEAKIMDVATRFSTQPISADKQLGMLMKMILAEHHALKDPDVVLSQMGSFSGLGMDDAKA
jgi:hypothetical protein